MTASPKQAPADVIVVVGHKLSTELQARIERASSLFLSGKAGALLLCGGGNEAATMQAYACKMGIPNTAIFLEQQSTTTLENALFAAPIIEQQQWRSAIIVSHGYHLARLWLCFRQSPLSTIKLAGTPFPKKAADRGRWLLALLREMIALPYYLVRLSGL